MNSLRKYAFNKVAALLIMFCIITGFSLSAGAEEVELDQEEKDYIARAAVIKAASIDGGAPLHYRDSKGVIKGIAVSVLEEIASMTGLAIDYELYDSISKAANSEANILFGVTKEYAPPGVILSVPYLESETILYYNSQLDPKQLSNRRFAAIEGGILPEGILEENTLYFNNREDAIAAIEAGQADYGLGNAYSLAFYTLQNGYKNIVTIPTGKKERAYCMGLTRDDKVLLSIINKSIKAIDNSRMQTLILDTASQVEKKITFPMIMEAYGGWIMGIIILAVVVLLFSVFSNIHSKNLYKMENRRYQLLAHISNESLFEYWIHSGNLEISDKFMQTIDMEQKGEEVTKLLTETLTAWGKESSNGIKMTIKLPLAAGGMGVFRTVCSYIYDEKGKPYSIIGKIIDMTEEVKEKEKLITKSQRDGLTGLYNSATAEDLITRSIAGRAEDRKDAFIIADCDNFKNINDTMGHLKGNLALQTISKALQLTFRQTDIIGRIGGDEFCVYMRDIPSAEFVQAKCRQLNDLLEKLNEEFALKLSIGIAILDGENTYNGLFNQADDALYHAKRKGGAQIVIFDHAHFR